MYGEGINYRGWEKPILFSVTSRTKQQRQEEVTAGGRMPHINGCRNYYFVLDALERAQVYRRQHKNTLTLRILSLCSETSLDYRYEDIRSIFLVRSLCGNFKKPHFFFEICSLLLGGVRSLQVAALWSDTLCKVSVVFGMMRMSHGTI